MAAQSPPNLFMWWTIKNQPAKTLSRWLDIFTADWLWQQESQTQPSLSFIQPGRLIIRFLNILQLVRCTGAAREINVHLDNNKLNIIESEHCLTQTSCPSQSPLSESADQVEAGAMPWWGWEVERWHKSHVGTEVAKLPGWWWGKINLIFISPFNWPKLIQSD